MKVADKTHLEQELLGRKLLPYVGRWVAVIDRTVVQDAATWDELLERLTEKQKEEAEVFHVSERPDATNLY
jgi:Family of unknown function (DUF5678)